MIGCEYGINQSVSQSVRQSVGRAGPVLDFAYSNPRCADWIDQVD